MLHVADFAKSLVKSENISSEDKDQKSPSPVPIVPPTQATARYVESPGPTEEYYDDKRDFKLESYNDHKNLFYQQGDLKSCSDFDDRKRKLSSMDTWGLPTGFSVGQVEKQRKGEKKTFYCEMCMVELSSLDTMKSHVSGVKHMKKELSLCNEREDKVRRGWITQEEAMMTQPRVKPVPKPESIKKKVPIRLHEKIRETMDAVVGLQYITEIIAVSDPEMEPHYQCSMCGSMGQSNGMFSHLMGHKHRQSFAEKVSADDRRLRLSLNNLSQAELLRFAKKNSQNNCILSDLIKTIRSDEKYPWPPGKAPWTVERGGTGIPPDGAMDNFGKRSQGIQPKLNNPISAGGGRSEVDVANLPTPGRVQAPSSRDEAERMIEMGRRLITMAMEYSGSGVGDRDARVIQATIGAVMTKVQKNLDRREREL